MGYFDRFDKGQYSGKSTLGKVWFFIWHEDSMESWLINIVLAFVIIKFIVYPGLGLILGTTHPIVAVVSGSMEHDIVKQYALQADTLQKGWTGQYTMCGKMYSKDMSVNFDTYWLECGGWYESIGINKDQFRKFSMHNGFNRGDIIILKGPKVQNIDVGDIIVFISSRTNPRPDPIIHRIVAKSNVDGYFSFQTKGDHNPVSIDGCDYSGCIDETDIRGNQIIGKAFIRVPYLGYIKIWAVDLVCLTGNYNFCIQS